MILNIPEASSGGALGNATPKLFRTLPLRLAYSKSHGEPLVLRLWLAQPSAKWFSQLHGTLIYWVWKWPICTKLALEADFALGHRTAHLASYDVIRGAK